MPSSPPFLSLRWEIERHGEVLVARAFRLSAVGLRVVGNWKKKSKGAQWFAFATSCDDLSIVGTGKAKSIRAAMEAAEVFSAQYVEKTKKNHSGHDKPVSEPTSGVFEGLSERLLRLDELAWGRMERLASK